MRRLASLLTLLSLSCVVTEDGNPTPRCALDIHCPQPLRCYRQFCVVSEDAGDSLEPDDDTSDASRGAAAEASDAGDQTVAPSEAGAVDAGESAPRTDAETSPATAVQPAPPMPAPPAGPTAAPPPPRSGDDPASMPPTPPGGGPTPMGAQDPRRGQKPSRP